MVPLAPEYVRRLPQQLNATLRATREKLHTVYRATRRKRQIPYEAMEAGLV